MDFLIARSLLILTILVVLFICIFRHIRNNSKHSLKISIIKSIFIFIFAIIYISLFIVGNFFVFRDYPDYYEQILPTMMYTPFATEHILSLQLYEILYIVAVLTVIIKMRKLPPLALSLCIVFIVIGTILNVIVLLQYLDITWDNLIPHLNFSIGEITFSKLWRNNAGSFAIYRIMNLLLSLYVILKLISQEKYIAINRRYNNKFLNKINTIIAKHYFICSFILLIPVFIIVTVILLLFGQESDSIVKVWTETTTWTFSQHDHPPFLDMPEGGHYLCTVAACGHPKIVKPLKFGIRHNKIIIVNRQLQIANAFEEMIANYFPTFHRVVRIIYDRYGYPISKKISNAYISDIVYILMKPFEFFFLINLYLFIEKPEELIRKQYSSK